MQPYAKGRTAVKIDKCILPKQTLPDGMATDNIPALIHQTFETAEVAPGMHAAAMSWSEQNPGFEYRFYDNADRRQTIAQHFPPQVLEAYDHITNGAFRADLWRYCQLYVDGGVYIDLDSMCKMPLQSLFLKDDAFVSARAGNLAHAVYNGFICASPEHPFLQAAIDRAVRLILESPQDFDGYMTTGPWNLGVAVNSCLGRAAEHEQQIGVTEMAGFRLRLLQKHPRTDRMPGHLTQDGTLVLLTEYPGYRDDLSSVGIRHWQDEMRRTGLSTRLQRKVRRTLRRFTGRT